MGKTCSVTPCLRQDRPCLNSFKFKMSHVVGVIAGPANQARIIKHLSKKHFLERVTSSRPYHLPHLYLSHFTFELLKKRWRRILLLTPKRSQPCYRCFLSLFHQAVYYLSLLFLAHCPSPSFVLQTTILSFVFSSLRGDFSLIGPLYGNYKQHVCSRSRPNTTA